uniref:Uncharacterized protein n=1 Tax=Monopterus albus TaxID=43700 RepID=A0A3Q3IHS2_MONAL
MSVPPILGVVPTRALVDEKFKVLVENLPPGFPVTIHSLHQSEDRDYWEAYGHYISDHRGTVSVSEDFSFGGIYTGKEPMGLLWSMHPVPGSRKGLRLRKMNVCNPMLVNISVYREHEGVRDQAPLASALTERWYILQESRGLISERKEYKGPCPGPFPGVLDLWGGGGGLMEYCSALLASRGYAALKRVYSVTSLMLMYFKEVIRTPFFYFLVSVSAQTAFDIIKHHPEVMPDRVGLIGKRIGAVVTNYLTAESTVIKVGIRSFISRSCFSFSLELAAVIYLPWNEELGVLGLFPVGKINCPMLLVNGHDDQNWPTVEYAEQVSKHLMMRKGHLLTRVEYPDAGHLIEMPFSPHFRATRFTVATTKEKVTLLWGGQTKPHSDAQEDSWRKILSFLWQHLIRLTSRTVGRLIK